MRIRKKLMVLHTIFSLGLATVLLVGLRPAILEVVERAERNEGRLLAGSLAAAREVVSLAGDDLRIRRGDAATLGIPPAYAAKAAAAPNEPIDAPRIDGLSRVIVWNDTVSPPEFVSFEVSIPEARHGVQRLYLLTAVALFAVYGLVALSLEVFVLPQQVYGPIRRMQRADLAVREGRSEEELIPDDAIPADELGQIMRSRNESIRTIREKEQQLSHALTQLESVATDLKRKNHLLETARQNLADADRLASLGMMSAGIAHELNTPLAVIKGLAERLNQSPREGLPPAEAALMLRVVGRLERLSESLLDFARVRPPSSRPVPIADIAEEAATLVRLDRDWRDVAIEVTIDPRLIVECDPDRMVQVFVNLVRNASEAAHAKGPAARVAIDAEVSHREGREWVSITITDNGPGIDPVVLSSLFEPFVSTRLDSRGTGLGLAVSEGIVREHGGVLLARNLPDRSGAAFEIVLPLRGGRDPVTPAPQPDDAADATRTR